MGTNQERKAKGAHAIFAKADHMKNIRTTILGVLTILAAVSRAGLEYLQTGNVSHLGELFSAITAGVGLIAASDSK